METEYPLAGLSIKLVLGATFANLRSRREAAVLFPQVVMTSDWEGSRPAHLMIIPNTKRYPDNSKMDQLPIFGGNYRSSKAVP